MAAILVWRSRWAGRALQRQSGYPNVGLASARRSVRSRLTVSPSQTFSAATRCGQASKFQSAMVAAALGRVSCRADLQESVHAAHAIALLVGRGLVFGVEQGVDVRHHHVGRRAKLGAVGLACRTG